MYNLVQWLIYLLLAPVGITFAQEVSTKKVEDIHAALPYAKLSKEIYNHDIGEDAKTLMVSDDNGNVWVRRLSERGEFDYTYSFEKCLSPSGTAMSTPPIIGMKGECRTETATRINLSGFHAEFYTNDNDGAVIVFRGTDLFSIPDWTANITNGLLQLYPNQYSLASDFVSKVLSSEHCKGNICKNIVVTGHSLGGALAQYVALSWGLKAYVFNSAGLGVITRVSFDSNMADKAEIVGFVGEGNKNGIKYGLADIVEKTGKRFYEDPIVIPIDLPLWVLDQLSVWASIHRIKNMYSSLRNMDSVYTQNKRINSNFGTASALIIDRSGSMIGLKTGPSGTAVSSKNDSDKKKLEKAKEATKAFILSREKNDMVSLSVFSDSASTVQGISTVNSIKAQIDGVLGNINASGATNIGAGLEQGFLQLSNAGDTYTKMAVLLSDGENNRGEWKSKIDKFKRKGWPVCTVGFGSDADETTLRAIAKSTGCIYEFSDISNIVNSFQSINAYASGESTILLTNDALSPQGSISYPFYVTALAERLKIYTSWEGSTLNIALTAPDGRKIDKQYVVQGSGRYAEGDSFQMLELKNPPLGKWSIEVDWSDPPPVTERVNLMITEKTDAFVRIHAFRPQYSISEPVVINVDAQELVGSDRKIPLTNLELDIQVQKPGPDMIRMVKARSSNWTMYKDVMLDVTRNVILFDDGSHDDYKVGDGIYGGTFTETDKNGAYLVTVNITGQKLNGESVKKTIIGVFQVGPITSNQVSSGESLQYMEQAIDHINDSTPTSNEIILQPLNEIDKLQTDPMDSIDRLMN